MLLLLWDPLPPAEAVSGNQDLITDILLRLPFKALLRFKCVSKHWLSLISDPHFNRHYRSLASAGIILLFELEKSRKYYICNPSRRQFLMLPPPCEKGSDESLTLYGVHLYFDPSKSPHSQVVCVRNCAPSSAASNDHYQIEIYSSETRGWRLSGSPFSAPFDLVFDNGVLWNGTLHWISPTGASLCFDILEQYFGEMPSLPSNEKWSKRRLRYFNESNDHLHLIEIYGPGTTHFQVSEMARDYSRWIPKYKVVLAAIVNAYPVMARSYLDAHDSRFYLFSILFVQEKEEESFLLLQIPGKFISYNLVDHLQGAL